MFTFLRANPLFSEVPDNELETISSLMAPVSYPAGSIIIQEGETGDSGYLLVSGEAEVVTCDLIGQETVLAVLGPGQLVGEIALLQDTPRTSTVRSKNDVEALRIDRESFQRLAVSCPEFHRRLSRFVELRLYHAFLRKASVFARLPDEAVRRIAEAVRLEKRPAGTTIIQEGEAGDTFYLVRSGSVEVESKGKPVAVLQTGDFFGETALLAEVPRTATVRALVDSELLVLSKDDFKGVVEEHATLRRQFGEILKIRFRGAPGQTLLTPDPISTVMPFLEEGKRKRYWSLLLGGIGVFILLSVLTVYAGLDWLAYSTLVVGALVGPVVYVVYLSESKVLSERPRRLVITFIITAMVSVPLAMLLEEWAFALTSYRAEPLLVGVIEETVKLLGVLWLLKNRTSRFMIDGVVYGAAAGMGFAALESMIYGAYRLDSVSVMLSTLWMRALLSPFGHGTWTAIAAAGIWRARSNKRFLEPAGLFALVVLLHTFWDWQPLSGAAGLILMLIIGAAGLMVLRVVIQRGTEEEIQAVVALNPEVADASSALPRLTCRSCGTDSPSGAHYCPRCGLALKT